jgi:hypothetical protein
MSKSSSLLLLFQTICLNFYLTSILACQDRRANATDGIIQPVKGLVNGPRMCLFTITVPSGQRVQMSCTDVNGMTSSLEVSGTNIISFILFN